MHSTARPGAARRPNPSAASIKRWGVGRVTASAPTPNGMAHAIYEALTAPRAVRAANAERIRDQAVAHPADAWLGLLVDHAC